ncbi:MAG: hypothetical protein H6831_10235 [Planctomycetes bacterium]|nr:hypothetical protein [Planctomycetota bacterium]
MRHPFRRLLLAACVLAACDQVVHYSVLSDGWLMGRRIAPFEPPLFCEAQQKAQEHYLLHATTGRPRQEEFRFDAQLGWAPIPGVPSGPMHFDWAGCRMGPAELAREKRAGVRRLMTIGCSFTLGEEVADDEAWPHRLDAAHDDVEVANLAMGAYGLDQALLRLRRDGLQLAPDEIWLGWLPAASLRVVTLYRPAQRHWSGPTLFKPRFRLNDDGSLLQVPNPATSIAHTAKLISRQDEFYAATWKHDMWVSRAERAYRAFGSSLLHRSALTRLYLTAMERGGRDASDWVLDEGSEVHQLVRALVLETAREARGIDARFKLLVLPGRDDLADRIERGAPYWAAVCADFEEAGIEVVDLSDALLAAGALESDEYWMGGGHYSALGNRVVAQTLEAEL